MKNSELHRRIDIIEETLSYTSRFNKFSGNTAIVTGFAVIFWAMIGIYLVATSTDYSSFVESLKLLTFAFIAIGLSSLLVSVIVSIKKSYKDSKRIFSPVTKNLLIQMVPYGILLFASIAYLLEGPGTNRLLYSLIVVQMMYALMIWSVKMIVPKVIGYFGITIFFLSFLYLPFSLFVRRAGFSISTEAIVTLILVAISLGLGHVLTGMSLRKHGQK